MKTKWNGELPQGMQELTMEAASSVVGGESILFWIGYGLGVATNAIVHLVTN
jgi:hypothetical protein